MAPQCLPTDVPYSYLGWDLNVTMFSESVLCASLSSLGVSSCKTIFESLKNAYGAQDRHYHDQSHVSECLVHLGNTSHLATRVSEVEIAIWFHDAIYDSTKGDNEERSADWAANYLSDEGISKEIVSRIHDMIIATKTHVAKTDDEALLLDIDLGILGSSEATFELYDQAIRSEYHWVPIEQYSAGRVGVLRSFLDRPRIYQTTHYYDALEQTARSNLARKIEEISNS